MADQLLFRGGNSTSIAGSTVSSREIVIDTQTNQVVLGSQKDRTVMTQGNTGYTGIGTVQGNPTGFLHISDGTSELKYDPSGKGPGHYFRYGGGDADSDLFRFVAPGDTEVMALKGNFVGIGTTTPDAKLVISEVPGSSTPAKMKFVNEGDRAVTFGFDDHNAQPSFSISSGDQSVKYLSISNSGSVGISTTTPEAKLEIGGNGEGIILASPNGTRYKITVANDGTLTTAAV